MSNNDEGNDDQVFVRCFGLSISGKGRPAMIIAVAIFVVAIVVALRTFI